ncbi:hypothetical protein BSL78_29865 [Apostichopus japonicus]|uniref:Uncharacterized protein n=1 Tax=Stichopus japonicus TaxID=307972 RepID=A0A2G8JC52_STIJA|nr:hypothetical protein BSL78_29865 [Apostichopus japonicus]
MLTELEPRGSNYIAYAISEKGDIHEMFIVSIGKSLAKTLATRLKKDTFFVLANKQEECSYLRLAADKSKLFKTSKSFRLPKEKVEKFFNATLCTIPDALASPKKRRLSVEGKVAKVYDMKEGPTRKRHDILLADEVSKKSICSKLWGEHSEKITENDTGSVFKISNVEVHVYNDRHQLKSTT